MRAVSAVAGVLAVAAVGFAPNAVAGDVRSKQWYLGPMQADQMWKTSTGRGVKVAVIDTGVNADTPSLKGQVLADEVPKSVAYRVTADYSGHGTTMAELIAGTGSRGGLQGLAPGAKIVPFRIRLEGMKDGAADERRTPRSVAAIRAAADTDVKIINMSFGAMGPSSKEKEAIEYAASKGKLLIAAVGNDGEKTAHSIGYPAAFPYVVGVSSSDEAGSVSKFSSSGGYVDFAAPGQDFPGWCDETFKAYCDDVHGTSPAAAITSASAALIWSAHPDWTVNQVTRALIDTAGRSWPKKDPSTYLGYGAVRPRLVLADRHYDPGPADVDPLAKENGGDLLAKSASTPASSTPSPSQPPKNTSSGAISAAGSGVESSSGSGNTLWIALGAVAAVLVIGGAAVAFTRARRAR
ncbi:S8 family serine peptidase [Streptomyces sp. NPDC090023]|uniref:S8 family serine peptidase n=1 Tax=unclassified Streptomyces TaxID=2593676 RepID=UPI003808AEDA